VAHFNHLPRRSAGRLARGVGRALMRFLPACQQAAGEKGTEMREIDLTSRVKYFGPTSTLSRSYSGTPVYAPAAGIEAGSLRERPLMEFDEGGIEAALRKFERFDDQIMGGISQSNIVRGTSQATGEAVAIFGGVVRVQGGGFAGCRMKMLQAPLDLSDSTGVYIKCRGDGKRYKLNMRSSPTSNEVVYQAEFTPPQDALATVRIPFSAFRLVKRSVPISGPPLGINTIYQMGLVLHLPPPTLLLLHLLTSASSSPPLFPIPFCSATPCERPPRPACLEYVY